MNGKRVGLYLRVSTGEQTVENQREALTTACAHRGWKIVAEFVDNGVSGAKGRDKRPGFDRLLKAATQRKIDVVAAWSVDRLGRSLQDLVGFLGELNGAGCDLYLERQAVDTTTPAGRALFQMLGVFAEFERAIITNASMPGSPEPERRGPRAASRSAAPGSTRRPKLRSAPRSPAAKASLKRRGRLASAVVRCNGSRPKWRKGQTNESVACNCRVGDRARHALRLCAGYAAVSV